MLDGTYTLMVTGMSNSGVNCVDIRYNSALVCSVNPALIQNNSHGVTASRMNDPD